MKLAYAVLIVAVSAFSSNAYANDRCPAGETGCNINNAHEKIRERVNEGTRKVIRNENPEGRVREVGETVKYCIKCGTDAIKEGADKISGKK